MSQREVKVTSDELLTKIGRLTIENEALNRRIDDLEKANAEISQELSKLKGPQPKAG